MSYMKNENLIKLFDRNTIDRNKESISNYMDKPAQEILKLNSQFETDLSEVQQQKKLSSAMFLSQRNNNQPIGEIYNNWDLITKDYADTNNVDEVYRNISLSYFPEETSPLEGINIFQPASRVPHSKGALENTAKNAEVMKDAVVQGSFDFMSGATGGAYRLLGQPEMAAEAVKRIESYRPELSQNSQEALTSKEWYSDPRFWMYQGTQMAAQILPIVKIAKIASYIPQAIGLSAKGARLSGYLNSVTSTAYYIANQNGVQAETEARNSGVPEDQLNNVYTEAFVPSLYINLAANSIGFLTGQIGEGAEGVKKIGGKLLGGVLSGVVGTEGELREQEAQEQAVANNLSSMVKTLPYWQPRIYDMLMSDDPEKFKLAAVAFIGESLGDSIVGHVLANSRSQGDRIVQEIYQKARKTYGQEYVDSFETPYELVQSYNEKSQNDSLKAAKSLAVYSENEAAIYKIEQDAKKEIEDISKLEKENKPLSKEQAETKEFTEQLIHYLETPQDLLKEAGLNDATTFWDFYKKHSDVLKDNEPKISMTKMRSIGSTIGEGTEYVAKRLKLTAKKLIDAKGDYDKFKESMRKTFGVAIDPHLDQLYGDAQQILTSDAVKQEIQAKALYQVMKKKFPNRHLGTLKELSDSYTKRTAYNNLINIKEEIGNGKIPLQNETITELESLAKSTMTKKEADTYIAGEIDSLRGRDITSDIIQEKIDYFNQREMKRTETKAKKATPYAVGKKRGRTEARAELKDYRQAVLDDKTAVKAELKRVSNIADNNNKSEAIDILTDMHKGYKSDKIKENINTAISKINETDSKREIKKLLGNLDRQINKNLNSIERKNIFNHMNNTVNKISKSKDAAEFNKYFNHPVKKNDTQESKSIEFKAMPNSVLDSMQNMINEQLEGFVPPEINETINKFRERNKPLRQIPSNVQLDHLANVLDTYLDALQSKQKKIKEKFTKKVQAVSKNIIKEQAINFKKKFRENDLFQLTDDQKINSFFTKYFYNYNNVFLTPEILFWKMDGNRYGELSKIYVENMQHGESLKNDVMRDFYNNREEVFGRKDKNINDTTWNTKEFTFKDANGKKFKLSKYEVISFFLTVEQESGLNHLLNGGLRVVRPDKVINYYKIDNDNIAEIYKIVENDKELMQVTEFTQDMYNMLSEYLNVRSQSIVGYDIAKVKNYFPIFSSVYSSKTLTDDNGKTKTVSASEQYYDEIYNPNTNINDVESFTKSVVSTQNPYKSRKEGATNPITLGSAKSVLMGSLKKDAQYYGFAEAYRLGDAVRKNKDNPIQDSINNTYGYQGVKAIDQIMGDLKENRYQKMMDSLFGKVINTVTKGVLGYNLPVAAIQTASYCTARSEIPTQYWSKGLVNLPKYISSNLESKFDFMGKYSSDIYMRYRGQIGWSAGESIDATKKLKGISGIKKGYKKVSEGGMVPIQHMDNATIASIWDGVTAEIEGTTKLKGDEKWNAVARKTEKVIHRTQPTFFRIDRPMLARSGNGLAVIVMRFSSQLSKNYGMAVQGFTEMTSNGNFEAGARTLTSLGVSVISVLLIKALCGAARKQMLQETFNRREQKDFIDNFWSQLGYQSLGVSLGNLGQGVNFASGLVLRNTGLTEPASTTLAQLVESGYDISKVGIDMITEDRMRNGKLRWKHELPKAFYDFMKASLTLSGVGAGDLATISSFILSKQLNKKSNTRY